MKKRIFSLTLCLCLLLGIALPAVAEENTLTLKSAEDFLEFAENCRLDSYSRDLTVVLASDIDLTGRTFAGIPIFCGTFRGNGHSISGVNLTQDGSVQGLFRYLTDTAVVSRLHVRGNIQPGGSRGTLGGIAGRNAGLIEQCSFTGTIVGNDKLGGITGENAVTGVVELCRVSGSITGNHFLGGIAGENAGVLRDCENNAGMNTTPQENQVELADITLDALTSTESVATITDIGGIAGTSSGVLRRCTNRGTVGYNHMGYNVGGIVGSQTGSVLNCENFGDVRGRKEVGGIVGHLEPAALIEYDEDALQILRRQLDAIGGTVNQATANVQHTASAMSGQIAQMGGAVQGAWESVSILIPDPTNPVPPDEDTLEAARNGLSDSLWELTGTLDGMQYVTQTSMDALSLNLLTLQQQVSGMAATLGNVSQTVKGSVEDVSDEDTELDLTGKVADCTNRGSVRGDLNVGGITGAMAMESDLEATSHMEVMGERSLNFVSKIRSVILRCRNIGAVSAIKQNMGGMVGFQTVGLVKLCGNTGPVGYASADHVGGIAGRSNGYLRENSAKGILTGNTCVGGIAGSGAIVSDCRSLVQIEGGTEKLGGILGISEAPPADMEDPIRDNLYAVITEDMGGIDGISYEGKAVGMAHREFLQQQDLPHLFREVTVTFLTDDGGARTRKLLPGTALPPEKIPPVPEKPGSKGCWEGLAEADLSCVAFDMTFHAEYVTHDTAIASESRRGAQPVLLVQGSFYENAAVTLTEADTWPPIPEKGVPAQSLRFAVSDAIAVTGGRILAPEGEDMLWQVWTCGADGSWKQQAVTANDSYLVFPLTAEDSAIAVIGQKTANWIPYAAAGAGVLAAAAAIFLLARKKRRR